MPSSITSRRSSSNRKIKRRRRRINPKQRTSRNNRNNNETTNLPPPRLEARKSKNRNSQVKANSLLPVPATTEARCLRHRPPPEAAKEPKKIRRLPLLRQNRPRKNWPVK